MCAFQASYRPAQEQTLEDFAGRIAAAATVIAAMMTAANIGPRIAVDLVGEHAK